MVDIRYELFLRDHIGAVDADAFWNIYDDAKQYFDKSEDIGALTDIFLECDIVPHAYFDYAIPGDYAYGSNLIKHVDVPDSIDRINYSAFQNSSLESISFGAQSQITSIGSEAFKDCVFLKTIHLPDTVEVISAEAFQGCNNLEHIYLGKNILRMFGDNIFKYCKKLTIHCYEGTKPHQYAIKHNIKFELIT